METFEKYEDIMGEEDYLEQFYIITNSMTSCCSSKIIYLLVRVELKIPLYRININSLQIREPFT